MLHLLILLLVVTPLRILDFDTLKNFRDYRWSMLKDVSLMEFDYFSPMIKETLCFSKRKAKEIAWFSYNGYILSLWFISVDIDCDHLAVLVFIIFFTVNALFFPKFPHCTYSLEESSMLEDRISTQIWGLFCKTDLGFSFFSCTYYFSIIHLCQHWLMVIYFKLCASNANLFSCSNCS